MYWGPDELAYHQRCRRRNAPRHRKPPAWRQRFTYLLTLGLLGRWG